MDTLLRLLDLIADGPAPLRLADPRCEVTATDPTAADLAGWLRDAGLDPAEAARRAADLRAGSIPAGRAYCLGRDVTAQWRRVGRRREYTIAWGLDPEVAR